MEVGSASGGSSMPFWWPREWAISTALQPHFEPDVVPRADFLWPKAPGLIFDAYNSGGHRDALSAADLHDQAGRDGRMARGLASADRPAAATAWIRSDRGLDDRRVRTFRLGPALLRAEIVGG